MPASKVSKKSGASKKKTKSSGRKKAGSSFMYNPIDPFNQYPNHETGEEEYGPIPPFGYNKHDVMNMKPFNPNVMSSMLGGPMMYPPSLTYGPGLGQVLMPPPFNLLGVPSPTLPDPSLPLLQPMVPTVPTSSRVATLPSLPTPGAHSLFPLGVGLGTHTLHPQQYHPTDPNNQFPHPLTGDLSNPGPALEGGINVYDPHNVIGAPQGTPQQNRVMRERMKQQPRHPRSPYILD